MRGLQTLFMLLITIIVGVVFIARTAPTDDQLQIQTLEAMVLIQQETIVYLQATPTRVVPTVDPDTIVLPESTTPANQPSSVSIESPTPLPDLTGGQIASVLVSQSIDNNDCADNPQSAFAPFDTLYGVVDLVDTENGDVLQVRFTYDDATQVIYEESFTIQVGGSYCRWYVVEPDGEGWSPGNYSVSYQVNDQPPVVAAYTITAAAQPTPIEVEPIDPSSTEENMDAMEDESP